MMKSSRKEVRWRILRRVKAEFRKSLLPGSKRRTTVQGFDKNGRIIVIARGRGMSAQFF
jgi:hypothetical protein